MYPGGRHQILPWGDRLDHIYPGSSRSSRAVHSKDVEIVFNIAGTATNNTDYKFTDNSPVIKIPAGDTSGTLNISAIEEFPENAEDDETIILTPSVTNANLNSIGDTTVTIKNNGLEFEKKDNPFIKLSKS